MHPLDKTKVINGRRYSTETAVLLAGNDYWDGHNHERHGTNMFLFRTPKGSYFMQTRSQWQGAEDGMLEAISEIEAMNMFSDMREQRMSFEEAFPGFVVEDA